jgi:hypothetical protein
MRPSEWQRTSEGEPPSLAAFRELRWARWNTNYDAMQRPMPDYPPTMLDNWVIGDPAPLSTRGLGLGFDL